MMPKVITSIIRDTNTPERIIPMPSITEPIVAVILGTLVVRSLPNMAMAITKVTVTTCRA